MKAFMVLCLLILIVSASTTTFAATITATGSGNWNSTSTNAPWPGGTVPISTDDVIIPNAYTVTVTVSATCASLDITPKTSAGGSTTKVTINTAVVLTVTGDLFIRVKSGGGRYTELTLTGTAKIQVGGNFSNGSTGIFNTGTGSIELNGTGAQNFDSGADDVYQLYMANSGNTITLTGNLTITDQIDFTAAGYIDINGNVLTINDWDDGDIPTLGADRYFIIDNAGSIVINGVDDSETANFPISTSVAATDFCRIDVQNTDGGTRSFTVNACNFVNVQGACSGGNPVAKEAVDFTWNVTSASTGATITVYWDDVANTLNSFDRADSELNHFNGTNWVLLGGAGGATLYSGNIYYKSGNTTSFSPFAMGGGGEPLPIELLFFKANLVDETVDLFWSTASETNNDYFTIERSNDGIQFKELGTMPGAGTSIQELSYNYRDHKPLQGTSYYRLKQTDFNGKFEYSATVAVEFLGGDHNFIIYPNPVFLAQDNAIWLNSDFKSQTIHVEYYNIIGELVHSDITTSDINGLASLHSIRDMNLIPGMYFVSLKLDNRSTPITMPLFLK